MEHLQWLSFPVIDCFCLNLNLEKFAEKPSQELDDRWSIKGKEVPVWIPALVQWYIKYKNYRF